MKGEVRAAVPLLIVLSSFCFVNLSRGLQGSTVVASFGSIRPRSIDRSTYFECSFSKTSSELQLNHYWNPGSPSPYPCEIEVWQWVSVRNPETGEYSANNPYGGSMRLVPDPTDPSRSCLEMALAAPGARPLAGAQHTKLYNVQDPEHWMNIGKLDSWTEPYVSTKEAYWRTKYWFPSDFHVQEWILIWQFCGEHGIYGSAEHTYIPQISLIFGAERYERPPYLGLNFAGYYFSDGDTRRFKLVRTEDIPKNQWVTIEVYVKQGSEFRAEDGTVVVWLDGIKVLEKSNLPTATYSGTPYVVWGIGLYASEKELYGQYMYVKDVEVTSNRAES